MTERYVIQAGRQCGKTYTIMTEIYELVLQGKASDVLVVFPALDHLQHWAAMWNDRFPHVPMVDYTTSRNMLKLRGKFYRNIYVEDVNLASDEGIYAPQWAYLEIAARDGSITFTSRLEALNQRSHSARTTAEIYSRSVLKRMQIQAGV